MIFALLFTSWTKRRSVRSSGRRVSSLLCSIVIGFPLRIIGLIPQPQHENSSLRFLLVRAQRGEFLQRFSSAQRVLAKREASRWFGKGGASRCRRLPIANL